MMRAFVPEDQCSICASVAPIARPLARLGVFRLPLLEPICADCAVAFWRNIGLPVCEDDGPVRH